MNLFGKIEYKYGKISDVLMGRLSVVKKKFVYKF